jgi:A/G-specific adenine glycosylase
MPRPSSTKSPTSQASDERQSATIASLRGPSKPLTLAAPLIDWQKRAGRHDLPWQVRDPYRVWLSEIMLQQTQVATVVPYYLKFLERFPDLATLASANEESVLEAWSGLGYYSRARNLHRCAGEVVQVHGGVFPSSIELLITLPGIGRSTAAAIAVFCFSSKEAILDGNVKRVLSRVFAIAGAPAQSTTEKELWQIALKQLPNQDIESYTQGLMDLGSSLCAPRKPKCIDCPLRATCSAFQLGLTHCLPSPKARKLIPLRDEAFALIIVEGQVLLERQKSPGIWGGLLSFPKAASLSTLKETLGKAIAKPVEQVGFDHSFTHFKLRATVELYRFAGQPPKIETSQAVREPRGSYDSLFGQEYRLLSREQIAEAALPQPIKAYLLNQALEHLK